MPGIWELLGIPPTRDVRAIKRAYAARLKHCQPEDDPEGFRRLHQAYSGALQHAQAGQRPEPRLAPPPQLDSPAVPEIRFGTPEAPPEASHEARRRRHMPPLPPLNTEPATQPGSPRQYAVPGAAPPSPTDDVQTLMTLLRREGEARAVAEFQRLLEQPRYQSLLAKEEFQKALLNSLPWTPPHPIAFLSALAERFGWHEGRHPYQRAYPRQFQIIRQVRDEHLARRMLGDFAASKTGLPNLYQRFMYRRAARLLLGRTPRLVYRFFTFDVWLKKYVGLLFKRVHQAYPLASEAIYDPTALHWCRVQLLGGGLVLRNVGYALLGLNAITAMVVGFMLMDWFSASRFAADYPNLVSFLCQAAAFIGVGVPLQTLDVNLVYLWVAKPRLHDTPARRLAAFWGAAALLYLSIAMLPPLWGLYLWGLAVALFLVQTPNPMFLALMLFVAGAAWSILNGVLLQLGPYVYTGPESHGWSGLNTPFLGWLFAAAVRQWHLQLLARRRWWPSYRAYFALLSLCTLALALAMELLVLGIEKL